MGDIEWLVHQALPLSMSTREMSTGTPHFPRMDRLILSVTERVGWVRVIALGPTP